MIMQGASRRSLAALQEAFDARRDAGADSAVISRDLLAVAALLTREIALRNALADPGAEAHGRSAIARQLFEGKLGADAFALLDEGVRARWSRSRDLVDSLEAIGAQAAFTVAESEGRLDRIEDELFRFGRTIAASADLRNVLAQPDVPAGQKQALLHSLLDGKADPTTATLLDHVVSAPRGRRIEDAVLELSELAAQRRGRIIADVRVAAVLTEDQHARLTAALERIYRRDVSLQVAIDPQVLGGAVVTVGDEVIDGTVLNRLEQARRQIAG
jgi:F-type H+-transporting ATPase subunit delta